MIDRVISFSGAIAGLYGFLVPPDFENSQLYAAALGVLLFSTYVIAELYAYFTDRDFVCREDDTRKINNEMKNIISNSGRSTILSRDLSWASDEGLFEKLVEKAKRDELSIHLQKKTILSEKLKEEGASVIYYEYTGFVPESRFTMMNSGQSHATIAIGFVRDGKRVIRRYRNGEEATFHLAKDLLRVLDIAVANSRHA